MIAQNTPDLATIMARLKADKLPPVHSWNPPFCGDIDMRIARDGTWYYMGSPIGRQAMVKLFSSVLRHDDDGKYYLVTPAEKIGITVEDAPFVAVECTPHGAGEDQTLVFRTNVDDQVIAGPDHPIRVKTNPDSGEPAPYLRVRDRLDALITRAVFYQLVELAVERRVGDDYLLGVWSSGVFFALGPMPQES